MHNKFLFLSHLKIRIQLYLGEKKEVQTFGNYMTFGVKMMHFFSHASQTQQYSSQQRVTQFLQQTVYVVITNPQNLQKVRQTKSMILCIRRKSKTSNGIYKRTCLYSFKQPRIQLKGSSIANLGTSQRLCFITVIQTYPLENQVQNFSLSITLKGQGTCLLLK